METTEESSLKVYSMHCMVWLRAKVACAQEAYGDMKVHCCAENFCNSPKYFNTGASNETHQNHSMLPPRPTCNNQIIMRLSTHSNHVQRLFLYPPITADSEIAQW